MSLAEVLDLIRRAEALLRAAEHAWPEAVEDAAWPAGLAESARIEDLLHGATHETESALGFVRQDIERLLARIDVRQRYASFNAEDFDRIVARGWSTPLVRELHDSYPGMPLAELSRRVKALCTDWGRLKPVNPGQSFISAPAPTPP